MGDDWNWLEEIEAYYKPCFIQPCDCDTQHDFAVIKLISCIKELRGALEIYANNFHEPFRPQIPALESPGFRARESLKKCAEGRFKK